ncbi:hypothetical protein HCU64_00130 [Methylobacterium sp. C25]|uniref:hypothetical protein n=1 Tax=Methylobacterium sp. C25 TaxID=2721622 RepID=UPI001F3180BF|nr:hypothetical protein [Methylobacterium sp. C25]MCE4222146.1 hypothetical protein [Methylobacterium sp. C25]
MIARDSYAICRPRGAERLSSMIEGFKRWRYRRQVRLYIAVLLYPDKERKVRHTLRDDVERWMNEGRPRGWSPQTVAVMTMAGSLIHVVRNDLTLLQRERYVEQLRDRAPQDVMAELDWLTRVKDGAGSDMEPFVFRFTFMNAMQASWLLRDQTIDIFTKGAFVTAVSWALTGVGLEEIYVKVSELADRIGTDPKAQR